MVVRNKVKKETGRYYIFGSYATKAEAVHAASVLRKDKSLRTHAKKNIKTGKWDTMTATVKKA